jgi:hypothetical protein
MIQTWIKVRDDLDTDPRVLSISRHIAKSAFNSFFTTSNGDLLGDLDVTASVTASVTVTRGVTVASLRRLWCDVARHGRYDLVTPREKNSLHASIVGDFETIDTITG